MANTDSVQPKVISIQIEVVMRGLTYTSDKTFSFEQESEALNEAHNLQGIFEEAWLHSFEIYILYCFEHGEKTGYKLNLFRSDEER